MADDLDTTLEEVRSLKASAKSARDDGDWADAIDDLHEAIRWLSGVRSYDSAPRSDAKVNAELADTYGQIGGIERRWGLASLDHSRHSHLLASVNAYDLGFDLERSLDAREGTTYNRINRLLGRVLLYPKVLQKGQVDSVDVLLELGVAEEILESDIGTFRQRDPWAYCDIGTIKLLLGTDWLPVIRTLERLQPPRFVYDSWLSILIPLSEVATSVRPSLLDLVRNVQRAARSSR